MKEFLSTREVCRLVGLSEPALRHVLRRSRTPRPAMHASARVFLWTLDDVRKLAAFLETETRGAASQEETGDAL